MNIGERIRYFREKANISGKTLAEKSGLVPSQIYKIESNTAKPSLNSLERICSALNISLAEFFSEEIPDLPPDLLQLLQEAKKLTPEQRKKLIEFIRSISE